MDNKTMQKLKQEDYAVRRRIRCCPDVISFHTSWGDEFRRLRALYMGEGKGSKPDKAYKSVVDDFEKYVIQQEIELTIRCEQATEEAKQEAKKAERDFKKTFGRMKT